MESATAIRLNISCSCTQCETFLRPICTPTSTDNLVHAKEYDSSSTNSSNSSQITTATWYPWSWMNKLALPAHQTLAIHSDASYCPHIARSTISLATFQPKFRHSVITLAILPCSHANCDADATITSSASRHSANKLYAAHGEELRFSVEEMMMKSWTKEKTTGWSRESYVGVRREESKRVIGWFGKCMCESKQLRVGICGKYTICRLEGAMRFLKG